MDENERNLTQTIVNINRAIAMHKKQIVELSKTRKVQLEKLRFLKEIR